MLIGAGVFSQIGAVLFSYIARRSGQHSYSAMASCIPPFLGTILLYVLPRSNQGGSLAALYLAYFFWCVSEGLSRAIAGYRAGLRQES
jgi:hypothetical protein